MNEYENNNNASCGDFLKSKPIKTLCHITSNTVNFLFHSDYYFTNIAKLGYEKVKSFALDTVLTLTKLYTLYKIYVRKYVKVQYNY